MLVVSLFAFRLKETYIRQSNKDIFIIKSNFIISLTIKSHVIKQTHELFFWFNEIRKIVYLITKKKQKCRSLQTFECRRRTRPRFSWAGTFWTSRCKTRTLSWPTTCKWRIIEGIWLATSSCLTNRYPNIWITITRLFTVGWKT